MKGETAHIMREFGMRASFGRSPGSDTHIARDYKGRLVGLEVLKDDPGKLLYDLQRELAEFRTVDPMHCTAKQLRQAADFSAQFESRLKAAEAVLQAGVRFFAADNFSLFRYLGRIEDSSRRSLEALAWDFDKGEPRTTRAA